MTDVAAAKERQVRAIIDRIKARETMRTDREVAAFLRVPYQTLSSWVKRGSIPFDVLVDYAECHAASLDWLVLGRNASPRAISAIEVGRAINAFLGLPQ